MMPGRRAHEIRAVAAKEEERIEQAAAELQIAVVARKILTMLRVLVGLTVVHMALQIVGLLGVYTR